MRPDGFSGVLSDRVWLRVLVCLFEIVVGGTGKKWRLRET